VGKDYMNYSNRLSRSDFAPSTFVELLQWRAYHRPDRKLFTFLEDGEKEEVHLTYSELDRKARAIAALLQSFVSPGERALLLYPPGLDYISAFFGCLYAGVVAVPAYPPDPSRLDRTLPRLEAILADVQVTVVLTTTPILSLAEFLFDQAPDLGTLQWMATDTVVNGMEYSWRESKITPRNLAFLQYTSGSTRAPKGVMVSHGNLMVNSAVIARAFSIATRDRAVLWLPPYHDMGLIGGILQPIFSGIHCILMSPISFLQKPLRWLQAISHYKATVAGGPNFGYDLCVRKTTPEQRAGLDLSSWTMAFTGSEPVRPETLSRFAAAFEPCGFQMCAFYPCYGLAESTLFVTGGFRSEEPVLCPVQSTALKQNQVVLAELSGESSQTLVGCGHTLTEHKVEIVHPDLLTRCPSGQLGEIWVSGPSVALGYWNQLEETDFTFRAYLADTGEGPFLRTGDLGFQKDGELFVTGRIKDLIIIRGRNHYPQDI
jgi:acyl-CoA synthetase (AMP-forming)/AMP-acid ligase II